MTLHSIADAAARTGLTATALRYDERDGLLLGPVQRTASGHRRYGDDDLRWITLLTRLRATGMPMRDVRRTPLWYGTGTATRPSGWPSCAPTRERVLADLADVRAHLDVVDVKIEVYEARLGAAAQPSRLPA